MNIRIFFGPKSGFDKIIPHYDTITLFDLAVKNDEKRRIYKHLVQGQDQDQDVEGDNDIPYYENVIAYSDDYAGLNEAAIQSFISFIYEFEIESLYLQNPPQYIAEQVHKLNNVNIQTHSHEYESINLDRLRTIRDSIKDEIIGQETAREQLIGALYPLARGRLKKPCVLLLYGNTGVGKTETAKILSTCLSEELFRKQFSMFQNNDFASYLFGGKHSQNCFARELLERESNIILLDEYDKPAPIFHSAFYQLFDEGIFEDKNYRVVMKNAIIICTSNFLSLEDIRKQLGDPIYSRFDAIIKYENLDVSAVKSIIRREYDKQHASLYLDEQSIVDQHNILNLLFSVASSLTNARQIKRVVREAITATVINQVL